MKRRQPIDTGIEQRGYIWQCAITADNKRYVTKTVSDKDRPCGRWNPVFTRKWAATKANARWQGVCKHCAGRKRQLNRGNVLPERMYYETRKEANDAADDANAQEDLIQAKRNQEHKRRFL